MRRFSLIVAFVMLALTGAAHAQEAPIYTVRAGDTLYSIAQRYGVTVEVLKALNDLEGTAIYPGQVLVVGKTEAGRAQAEREPAAPDSIAAPDSVQVRPDTLQATAMRRAADISQAVRPPPDAMRAAGDTARRALRPAPGRARGARLRAVRRGVHVVRPGDTLYEIAARYGVPVDTLRVLNAPVPTFLSPGTEVRLPQSRTVRTHVVQPGQSLYDLAARYGVSVRALKAVNSGLQEDSLAAGMRVRIPGPPEPPAPPGTLAPPDTSGLMHVYPASFAGRLTASGARYDPQRFTASHPTLPFGAVVLLTNPAAGRYAFAVITDRGPLDPRFLMDVSAAVARQLGLAAEGEQSIELRVVR